jgi:hypothetical protein
MRAVGSWWARSVVAGQFAHLEPEVPALRHDGDGAVGEVVDLELGRGVEDAEAVGTHQHSTGRPDAVPHDPLAPATLRPGLAEAGAHDDDGLGASCEGVVDHLLEGRGLHGHDDELRGLREGADGREGRLPEHLADVPVDEVHASPVLAQECPTCRAVSPLRRVARRTDDREGGGLEECGEISRGRPFASSRLGHSPFGHTAV